MKPTPPKMTKSANHRTPSRTAANTAFRPGKAATTENNSAMTEQASAAIESWACKWASTAMLLACGAKTQLRDSKSIHAPASKIVVARYEFYEIPDVEHRFIPTAE